MGTITYKRAFQHEDWIDNEDVVQAGGEKGFNVKFHAMEAELDTISGVIAQLSAGLGAFQPVDTGGAVAYIGGNVGIGTGFSAASPPTYRLQVDLGKNTGSTQQVRFGNVVCSNGEVGAFAGYAVFSHWKNASDNNYALRQSPNGDVQINAPAGRSISFNKDGDSPKLEISTAGNVLVGGANDDLQAGHVLQVKGGACKTDGSSTWATCSDARLKEDIRDLEVGLAHLRRVRPVRFRYNGKAGTTAGQDCIGVLGQEIEKIFPEMIRRVPGGLGSEPDIEDLRLYDGSALTFVLVNAIKELAAKVEELELALVKNHKQ